MIDISEILKLNGDVNYADSFIYKTRNVLVMGAGADPYYDTVGLKSQNLINYKIDTLVINAYVSQYLGSLFIIPESVIVENNEKGELFLNIIEDFSYLKIENGVVLEGIKNKREIDVKL